MAKLVKLVEGVRQREYPLVGGTLRIGRETDNDIQLDDDTVSGHHCEIAVTQSQFIDGTYDYWLRDLGSTNGTKVNGQRINRHILQHEDELVIGPYSFHFLEPTQQGRARTTRIAIDERD